MPNGTNLLSIFISDGDGNFSHPMNKNILNLWIVDSIDTVKPLPIYEIMYSLEPSMAINTSLTKEKHFWVLSYSLS